MKNIQLQSPIILTHSLPNREPRTITLPSLRVHFNVNADRQTITASIMQVPRPVILYSVTEFSSRAGLTEDQHLDRLNQIMGEDKQAFLQSLLATTGPVLPPATAPELLAAYDAAKQVFDSMSLGKQAMWEPVRQAVGTAILSGDLTKAYGILATLPAIYEGAEEERQAFLALFAQV